MHAPITLSGKKYVLNKQVFKYQGSGIPLKISIVCLYLYVIVLTLCNLPIPCMRFNTDLAVTNHMATIGVGADIGDAIFWYESVICGHHVYKRI